jgi:hypothetical protein
MRECLLRYLLLVLFTAISSFAPIDLAHAQGTCQGVFKTFRSYADILGKNNPLTATTLGGIPESSAFTRIGIILQGIFKPKLLEMIKDTEHGDLSVYSPSGKSVRFDGIDYVEFPNSTAMSTFNSTNGLTREFILTRGVRPYKAGIRLGKKGANSPDGYVSDVLLFEMIDGKPVYRHRMLDSVPEKIFFFEDPRISVIHGKGRARYFLSGTDYSPHIKNGTNPDVMNRYVELVVNERGLPLRVAVDEVSKKPAFKNLSPEPSIKNGEWLFIDAKNATIAQNDFGQIVVRTRLRPDFNKEEINRLFGKNKWQYAEQVFKFRNFEHFESYNWNDAIVDLLNKRGIEPTSSDVAPLLAKTIILESDLKEHLRTTDENTRLTPNKAKGLGPGTRPLRVQRRGDELLISDGPGSSNVAINKLSAEQIPKMKIKDGETIYLTFDHEIRYYDQVVDGVTLVRRNYTASIKVFSRTLTTLVGYMPDVIQAKESAERGLDSGILDLQHVYPMGFTIHNSAAGDSRVRVYAGASDAHTTAYDFDIAALLSGTRPANQWFNQ